MVTILIVINLGAYMDYSKGWRIYELALSVNKKKAIVVRDGKTQELDATEVVVGDVLVIKYGDVVCADGIFLEGNKLKIDEASLTGEPDAIAKGDSDPLILSGIFTNILKNFSVSKHFFECCLWFWYRHRRVRR